MIGKTQNCQIKADICKSSDIISNDQTGKCTECRNLTL